MVADVVHPTQTPALGEALHEARHLLGEEAELIGIAADHQHLGQRVPRVGLQHVGEDAPGERDRSQRVVLGETQGAGLLERLGDAVVAAPDEAFGVMIVLSAA